tara:strand:- start:52766 stop:53527 length:762 start_codon:yes stop_codon:yes gene_type:complete
MKKYIRPLDMKNLKENDLIQKVKSAWGDCYTIYYIFNVSKEIDWVLMYENLASTLGEIRTCHPVNNKETKFSKSRDIKYEAGVNHYFASNIRQPLHNDYAYYESSQAPDWLMLYCLEKPDFGGKTHILSLKTLVKILNSYNPELLEKIKIDVTWKYNGQDGDKIHKKPIYNGQFINWNYWQINHNLNDKAVVEVKEEFFSFLENVIVGGSMYDHSVDWAEGDCIIFNDKVNLHCRDAFLGNRWLKDHAFFGQT